MHLNGVIGCATGFACPVVWQEAKVDGANLGCGERNGVLNNLRKSVAALDPSCGSLLLRAVLSFELEPKR